MAPLDIETERRLARAWKEGDDRAGAQLIEANLPFVIRIAREYRHWGVPLEDLIQQGNLGLWIAARKYDAERGYRLISYAGYWIRAEIRDLVVRSYRIVRLGATGTERRAVRVYRRHAIADAAELARESGMPSRRAEHLWPLLANGDVSLDASDGSQASGVERLGDRSDSSEQRLVRDEQRALLRRTLSDALARLDARERRIVDARMLAEEPRTLAQLGAEMGVSKERVRQIETTACMKLRAALAECQPAA